MIKKAFVLAAGLGTRMRPLTDNIPKPMVMAEGRTLIDRALDRLVEAGVEEVVVNTHYKAEVLHEHLAKRKDVEIRISHEPVRLETGGGILNALELIGIDPFYVITSDVILTGDGLLQLEKAYDDGSGALLLHEAEGAYGYDGQGDFDLTQDPSLRAERSNPGWIATSAAPPRNDVGRLEWRKENQKAKYVFTGLQILNPELFLRDEVKKLGDNFPLNKIYKLYLDEFIGVVNGGKWYHIGTPEALHNLKLK